MEVFTIILMDDSNWSDTYDNYWYSIYQLGYYETTDANLWLQYRKGIWAGTDDHEKLIHLRLPFIKDVQLIQTVED
jgi:hypothetical protein